MEDVEYERERGIWEILEWWWIERRDDQREEMEKGGRNRENRERGICSGKNNGKDWNG